MVIGTTTAKQKTVQCLLVGTGKEAGTVVECKIRITEFAKNDGSLNIVETLEHRKCNKIFLQVLYDAQCCFKKITILNHVQ